MIFFFPPDEDCYKIVEAKKNIISTSKNVEHVPSDETIDGYDTNFFFNFRAKIIFEPVL